MVVFPEQGSTRSMMRALNWSRWKVRELLNSYDFPGDRSRSLRFGAAALSKAAILKSAKQGPRADAAVDD